VSVPFQAKNIMNVSKYSKIRDVRQRHIILSKKWPERCIQRSSNSQMSSSIIKLRILGSLEREQQGFVNQVKS
jgi:hypothetical protein